MIELSSMEKELNKILMKGYRLVFLEITKEIRRAAAALKKTNKNAYGEEIARNLCSGANREDLVKLSNEMNACGEYLIKVADEVNKNISDKNNDLVDSDTNDMQYTWFEEITWEHGHIVDRMLSKYDEILEKELSNNIRQGIYGNNN